MGEGKGILEDVGTGLGKVWEEEADEGGLRSAEDWGLMSAEQEAEEVGLGSGRSAEQEEEEGGLRSWSSQTEGVGVGPTLLGLELMGWRYLSEREFEGSWFWGVWLGEGFWVRRAARASAAYARSFFMRFNALGFRSAAVPPLSRMPM